MNVNQLKSLVDQLVTNGRGEYPVQLQVCEKGLTFAQDVDMFEAQDYDGDRIWIIESGESRAPEWLCDAADTPRTGALQHKFDSLPHGGGSHGEENELLVELLASHNTLEAELAEVRKALVSAYGVGYDETGWQDLARVALDMYGRKP